VISTAPPGPAGRAPREFAELRVIRQALQSCNGNVAATARLLKLSRGTLYKRLAKLRGI
jgi:transcriptional regulator of acetoin/glycerol metabolism